jgi:flagellar secretion chaperone FliS
MHASASDAYLETQVTTATPQRLRLMLIDAAQRRARAALAASQAGTEAEGTQAIRQCRDIVAELIAGIRPDQTPEAKRVLAIYVFLFSKLVEAEFAREASPLNDIIRVLEEERKTWQAVCEQMADRPVAQAAVEETAPQRVTAGRTPGYRPAAINDGVKDGGSAFSIDA